jgi:hypothetical protein
VYREVPIALVLLDGVIDRLLRQALLELERAAGGPNATGCPDLLWIRSQPTQYQAPLSVRFGLAPFV